MQVISEQYANTNVLFDLSTAWLSSSAAHSNGDLNLKLKLSHICAHHLLGCCYLYFISADEQIGLFRTSFTPAVLLLRRAPGENKETTRH